MKIFAQRVNNEEGSILLITLVMLILLTIAGLGILSTTDTDLQITRNDRCFKQNLTRAESAVMEAAQTMAYFESKDEEIQLKPDTSTLAWINADPVNPDDFHPFTDNWTSGNSIESPFFADSLSGYTTLYEGIAPGASLDLSSTTTMRQYEIIGRAGQCDGQLDIIAGYRIRF